MRNHTGILLSVLVSMCSAQVSKAQSPSVQVEWDSRARMGVEVYAFAPNKSGREAGSMAMERACELGRGEGKPYLAVRTYLERESSNRQLVERGRTAYRAGSDGVARPVGYEADRYRNIPLGSAMISVTLISEVSLPILKIDFNIIETQGCTVYSKKISR